MLAAHLRCLLLAYAKFALLIKLKVEPVGSIQPMHSPYQKGAIRRPFDLEEGMGFEPTLRCYP